MGIQATALDGSSMTLESSAVDAFAASIRGSILKDNTPGYDESRGIWNAMIDRRPALIVRCLGVGDVVAAVNFARDSGIALCIRGGGHNISGLAVADGALMIDMSGMRGVFVDPENRVAHAQAGCLLGDVDRETQVHGLAAVLGFVSATGIAGLTLGGGFGYLTRRYGWTSDNVRSIQVVMADGKLMRASEGNEPELFWGLRGAGWNYGVATDFEYDLYPVGPEIVGGAVAWRGEDAAAVLDMYRVITEDAPPEMVCVAALRLAPPAPWLPQEIHGKPVVMLIVCDTGPTAEAEKRAKRIKSFGKPIGDVLQRRPYTAQQALLDATQPSGRRYYWKSEYLPAVTSDMLESYVAHSRKIESPHSALLLFPLNGRLNELPEDHSAVGNRKTGVVVNIAGAWDAPADDEKTIGWARDAWEDLRRFSTGGTYVNFLTEEERNGRIEDAYGGNYKRLAAIKKKYDPQNLFRINKNIAPR